VRIAFFSQRKAMRRILAAGVFVLLFSAIIIAGSRFYSSIEFELLQREITFSSEKIQGVSIIRRSEAYFKGSNDPKSTRHIEKFFQHISSIRDISHINVYDANYKVIWSDHNNKIIGKSFKNNEELKLAYTGTLKFNRGGVGTHDKEEHEFLPEAADQFVECYIPVWNEKQEYIIGVVEIYKSPEAIFELLNLLRVMIMLASLVGGFILCGLLYWISSMVLQRQVA